MNFPPYQFIQPPLDATQTAHDNTVAFVLVVICCVSFLGAAVFTIRDWRRTGSPVSTLLLLGGFITAIAEPYYDFTTAVWFPRVGDGDYFWLQTVYGFMTRNEPLWLPFCYVGFFGVLPAVMYPFFRDGASKRAMWLWFVVPILADIVLEESLQTFSNHLYIYYGNQPLRLHTFPIYQATFNMLGVYASACLLAILTPLLSGWRTIIALFATLLITMGSIAFVGWPATYVINSSYSFVVTQLGGIGTFVLAGVGAYVCILLTAKDSPLGRSLAKGTANYQSTTKAAVAR